MDEIDKILDLKIKAMQQKTKRGGDCEAIHQQFVEGLTTPELLRMLDRLGYRSDDEVQS